VFLAADGVNRTGRSTSIITMMVCVYVHVCSSCK